MYQRDLLLSQSLADKNSQIMTMYFQLNKKLDNFVNFIQVNYVMDNLANALHQNYAHRAPISADAFSDFNALYSYRSAYFAVDEETTDYNSFLDGVEDIISYLIDIDNLMSEAREEATRSQTYDYITFIDKQFEELRIYKAEFVALYDKAEKYLQDGNSLEDIDARYEQFVGIK